MEPAGTRRGACEIIKTEKARSAFELWPLSLQQSFLRLPLSHGRALRMFPAIPDQAEHRDQPCETRPHRRPPVARRPQEQCADRFLPELSRSALQVARSESPFRVNRVGLTACRRLPLCPRQRKSSGRPGRSVSCQQATLQAQLEMKETINRGASTSTPRGCGPARSCSTSVYRIRLVTRSRTTRRERGNQSRRLADRCR
jgi:hypothetical protein